jgi:peptidoglycan hydrolase CwlO-like protein
MRRVAWVVCVLAVAGAVAALGGVAGAQTIDSLNSRISAAKDQASSLAAEVQQKVQAASAARAQAVAAAAKEAQLSSVLAEGEAREASLRRQMTETQDRLERTRAQLHRALAALSSRLVAIYKGDAPDMTELLLSSHGFDDLASRADYLEAIQHADAALAGRVRSLRDQVAVALRNVTDAHEQAVAFDQRMASARDQMAAVRANAEQQVAALEAARQQAAASLSDLNGQVSGWEQQVQHLQQVSTQQAQQTVSSWMGDWAIPEAVVMCESGGNFRAVNPSSGAGGAYQILPSTWRLYGGQGLAEDASPAEQSSIAAQIWADSGPGAWVCAGG